MFELNLHAGELRKQGIKIKLSRQALNFLGLLLEQPGQVQTREQLQRQLWPVGTFVHFEHSLNKLVHELRAALGDSAINPRYIETVAGQGYRFIPFEHEPAGRAPRPRSGRRISSLAVLQFTNESGDPEIEFISKRVTERIIDTVSRITGMRVVAYGTVQRYRGRDLDPRVVGHNLQVDAVAAGEIVRRDEALFLHVELIDVADGAQLWGAQFQEACSGMRPEELADKICAQLQPVLTAQKKKSLQDTDVVPPRGTSHN